MALTSRPGKARFALTYFMVAVENFATENFNQLFFGAINKRVRNFLQLKGLQNFLQRQTDLKRYFLLAIFFFFFRNTGVENGLKSIMENTIALLTV